MKNSKIAEIYDKIELDEFSKQKMFTQIKEKVYNQGAENKGKIWNYKKITPIIAVCACAIIAFKIPGVQATIQEYINNFASWISGNSKDDYLEEVNLSVENNNMSLKIVNAQRVDNEVRLRYEITFPKNIEDIINLDEYGYKEYEDEYEKYGYMERIYNSDIFNDCKIYINNVELNDISNYSEQLTEDEFSDSINNRCVWFVEVKDVEVKEDKLIQEVFVALENRDEDVNFKFEFNKFKLENEIINANLNLEYTLKGGEYSNEEIVIKPIDYKAKLSTDCIYNFYGYSYTRTGIKIYAKTENETDDFSNVILKLKDNYGTEYLMYGMYINENSDEDFLIRLFAENNNEKNHTVIFKIYDGLADINNEYADYFNDNIKSIDIEVLEELIDGENEMEETKINKISEFNINFEENNE